MRDFIYSRNKDSLTDIAIEYMGNKITYGQLFTSIDQTAKAFTELGVNKGDVVCISSVILPEVIYSIYALSCIGAVAAVLDPRRDEEQLHEILKSVNAKVVLCIDLLNRRMLKASEDTSVESIISISPADSLNFVQRTLYSFKNKAESSKDILSWKRFSRYADSVKEIKYLGEPADVCVMTYTSGTTGAPKGVMLTNHSVNSVAFNYDYGGMPHERKQRFLNTIPPFVVYGISMAFHLPIALGMTCVLIPKFEPSQLYQYLKKYKPNDVSCPPSNFEKLVYDDKDIDLSNIFVFAVGGDYISERFEEDINTYLKQHGCTKKLIKGYGMTEVGSSACTTIDGYDKPSSVGFPLLNMTISIFKPGSDHELPYGEEGEICITGPQVMKGYYQDAARTDEILREHQDGIKWIHTGDIGMMDSDGFLYVYDRIKRIIWLPDDKMILPSKVERLIRQVDGVKNCAVVASKTNTEKACVVAYVVGTIETNPTHGINEKLSSELPQWMLPEKIIQIDELPLTPMGKIDYIKLQNGNI